VQLTVRLRARVRRRRHRAHAAQQQRRSPARVGGIVLMILETELNMAGVYNKVPAPSSVLFVKPSARLRRSKIKCEINAFVRQ